MEPVNNFERDARVAKAAARMRKLWADPEWSACHIAKIKEGQKKRLASGDYIRGETLAQFLREYVEPDPSGNRRYRFSAIQLARRYLISRDYVHTLAKRNGARRNSKLKRLRGEQVGEIIHLFKVNTFSIRKIAQIVGVTPPAVRYRLKKAGLYPEVMI